MPRGGARPGSGRKPADPTKPKKFKAAAAPVAHTERGVKTKGAPKSWPFGVEPVAPPAAAPAEPPAPPAADLAQLTPLEYLLSVMRDPANDERTRIQAATNAAPYVHGKVGEAGKKNDKQNAAKRVGAGKFASSAPPLKLVNRS